MNKMPKVSILITSYNSEKWIGQAIDSALSQTYPDKEILVFDDGSQDASLEIIKSFKDRVYWEVGLNAGANKARNKLLTKCSGEWLQYLDGDDYLLPDKITQQITVLNDKRGADVIYSPVLIEETLSKARKRIELNIPDKKDFIVNFISWGPLQTSALLWRKSAILEAGGWDEKQIVCQEHELMSRLICLNKSFFLYDKPGSVYRNWKETSTSRINKRLTVSERMRITAIVEEFLRNNNCMTKSRMDAASLSRFECARYIYPIDPQMANSLMNNIHCSDKCFRPHGAAATSLGYRFFYSIFGFDRAEKIAGLIRIFRKELINER